MKRCRLITVLSGLVLVGSAGVLAAGEGGAWRSLFDGKTLDGWEQHGGKAVYKVEDGTIVGHSVPNTQNSFLCTKERFGDFELELEVKCDKALNSGVQIRSHIKDKDRVWGPQVEIAVGPDSAGYIYGEATGRGWLSPERSKQITLKPGWNQYRVLCKGDNIKTWVNGQPVANLTDKKSAREGLIGLQVHGVGKRTEPLYVRWRNIKIRAVK
jgi:hypothetical protein